MPGCVEPSATIMSAIPREQHHAAQLQDVFAESVGENRRRRPRRDRHREGEREPHQSGVQDRPPQRGLDVQRLHQEEAARGHHEKREGTDTTRERGRPEQRRRHHRLDTRSREDDLTRATKPTNHEKSQRDHTEAPQRPVVLGPSVIGSMTATIEPARATPSRR